MNNSIEGTCALEYKEQLCLLNDPQYDYHYDVLNALEPEQPCFKLPGLTNHTYPALVVLSSTELFTHLNNYSAGMCAVVYFYAVWCPFSMKLAPAINSIGRIFPTVPIFAVDFVDQVTSTHNHVRLGTVALPNLVVFQGSKPILRFNQSGTELIDVIKFVQRTTRVLAKPPGYLAGNLTLANQNLTLFEINENDLVGPMPVTHKPETDWVMVFSTLFMLYLIYNKLKKKQQ